MVSTTPITSHYAVTRELPNGAEYERTLSLSALVVHDSGDGCDSLLCIVWADDATVSLIADLDAEERVGAMEAVEDAFYRSAMPAPALAWVCGGARAVA